LLGLLSLGSYLAVRCELEDIAMSLTALDSAENGSSPTTNRPISSGKKSRGGPCQPPIPTVANRSCQVPEMTLLSKPKESKQWAFDVRRVPLCLALLPCSW
jgi:hypothetical protein